MSRVVPAGTVMSCNTMVEQDPLPLIADEASVKVQPEEAVTSEACVLAGAELEEELTFVVEDAGEVTAMVVVPEVGSVIVTAGMLELVDKIAETLEELGSVTTMVVALERGAVMVTAGTLEAAPTETALPDAVPVAGIESVVLLPKLLEANGPRVVVESTALVLSAAAVTLEVLKIEVLKLDLLKDLWECEWCRRPKGKGAG